MGKMINTRIAFEKLQGITGTYSSWMNSKIKKYGITDYKVTYSKKDRRKLTIFIEKEDWEKILEGVRVN